MLTLYLNVFIQDRVDSTFIKTLKKKGLRVCVNLEIFFPVFFDV